MTDTKAGTFLQLRSLVRANGELELSLAEMPIPTPAADEVLVKIQATPINPSDIGMMFGAADMGTAVQSGTVQRPVVTARIPERAMSAMAGRAGESMTVGIEGAGTVVDTGSSPAARALMGKLVAAMPRAMYGQYRCIPAAECLVLPAGTTPSEGASCFVNPLTALGMVETMRLEGHTALVHTAAASNLGQMLLRMCLQDGIPLVNIVRKPEQAAVLRNLGAVHVCDSSTPTFMSELTEALAATRATIAFDATGGGTLAGQILTCMESALSKTEAVYSRYGSSTLKQVYIYGRLDTRPLELSGSFGMTWAAGGWLLFQFLQKIGPEAAQRLRDRVVAELMTTFASKYTKTVSLAGALDLEAIAAYRRRATGEKYLIDPSLA
ncbi:MAG: NADH oxidase [Acidimicrobiia bacterium]|nr:NADH oxidase [Acidimicrobiia bacterium]